MLDSRFEVGIRRPEDGHEYENWLDAMEVFPNEPKCSGIPRAMHENSRCLHFNRLDQYANQVRLSQMLTSIFCSA